MLVADSWNDYELIDVSNGEKLERWGKYTIRRPDPQVIWPSSHEYSKLWNIADIVYDSNLKSKDKWKFINDVPSKWTISYENLKFYIEPAGYKNTGLFPEQAVNWDWMMNKIKDRPNGVKVLNLFGYTGGATVACTSAGAEVCHVDASKASVTRVKENIALSGLGNKPIRYIVDDCFKFVKREIRRGNKYDAIIMDPPSYGRGPGGEMWKIESSLCEFIASCVQLLSAEPVFFLVNSHTAGMSSSVIDNILRLTIGEEFNGSFKCGEIGLRTTSASLVLPGGIYGRWESK